MLLMTAGARAQNPPDEQFTVLTAIQIPGPELTAFDIGFVDPVMGLYLLSDRTHATLDVFDTETNTLLYQLPGFVGSKPSAKDSGPDGVLTVHSRFAVVGDGDSTVKFVDLVGQKIIKTVSTGGTRRADEMAYDPRNQIVIVANDAETPPYVSFLSAKFGHFGDYLGKLDFADATNGLEQPQWSFTTGLFYQAVPEVNHVAGSGVIAVIEPTSMKRVRDLPVADCTPAGLAIGPNREAMVGCNNEPVKIISLDTGNVIATYPNIGHADEVWYNPGDGHYFVAAGSNPGGAVVGVIDAFTHVVDQVAPSVAGNHSIAADPIFNRVYVASRAFTSPFVPCTNGCIIVAAPIGQDDPGIPPSSIVKSSMTK